jgi:NAD(P)-dependent dehydrogenase (short-subunit alcohol dehydrogenase family)
MKKWTVKDIPSQSGKLVVVTGGNSGIGWYAALELARAGAQVILTARTETKGRDAVQRIHRLVPLAQVNFELLDLASLHSVRDFAAKIDQHSKLDQLVNNAGVMAVPDRRETKDGFEIQFGTNYLGPFALTMLLLPALHRAPNPRVTTVASLAANMGPKKINFDDLQWERSYSPWKAYCQSKLGDLLLMMELARRADAEGIRLLSNAAHPGYARTNLQTSGPERQKIGAIERLWETFTSQDAAHGALPTLRAATSEDTTSRTYYAPDRLFHLKGDPVQIEVPKPAQDVLVAQNLWEISEKLTGTCWPFTKQSMQTTVR